MLEYIDEVDEKIESMKDVVIVTHSPLLNDTSRIVTDESAEDKQSSVQVDIKQESRLNEDVDQANEYHQRQKRKECSSQVQIFPVISKERAQSEATKDDTC